MLMIFQQQAYVIGRTMSKFKMARGELLCFGLRSCSCAKKFQIEEDLLGKSIWSNNKISFFVDIHEYISSVMNIHNIISSYAWLDSAGTIELR